MEQHLGVASVMRAQDSVSVKVELQASVVTSVVQDSGIILGMDVKVSFICFLLLLWNIFMLLCCVYVCLLIFMQ